MINIFEKFKNEKFAVNCQTLEEAKQFVKLCYENGIEWGCYKGINTFFHRNKDCTCYAYDNNLCFYAKAYLDSRGYEIMTFVNFIRQYNNGFCKSDLKTGMHVITRNGDIHLVLPDYKTRISGTGALINLMTGKLTSFNAYTEDLLMNCPSSIEFDIAGIYMPIDDNNVLSHDLDNMTLIWERE